MEGEDKNVIGENNLLIAKQRLSVDDILRSLSLLKCHVWSPWHMINVSSSLLDQQLRLTSSDVENIISWPNERP